mgnify:CR=1 FL=1
MADYSGIAAARAVATNGKAEKSGDDEILATARQRLHGPLHQRLAAYRQQRLGGLVGEWAHALTATGRQNQGAGLGRVVW